MWYREQTVIGKKNELAHEEIISRLQNNSATTSIWFQVFIQIMTYIWLMSEKIK